MGCVTIRKGQGIIYEGLGWHRCKCGQMGFHYRWRGRHEVKHVTPAAQAGQLTFGNGLQLVQQRKQKTCYIPKRRAR